MLTSKQRARLRSLAQPMNAIFLVGKQGITDEFVHQLNNAITARELVKAGVQENCPCSSREAADKLAELTGSDVVAVIGRKFVLWRRNPEKSVIELE